MPKLIVVLSLIIFCSCAGLKRSQIEATTQFATAAKNVSRVPADIYYRLFLLKSESQTLQLNTALATNNNTKESIGLIRSDYDDKISFLRITEEYSAAYLVVEQYASLVLALLDQRYLREFSKTKNNWQVSFERMIALHNAGSGTKIPPTIGRFTAALILDIGSFRIKELQRKYLRNAISIAREPFEAICTDFVTLDSLKIKSELNALPGFLNNNYANFLENIRAQEKEGNNPFVYHRDYTPVYTSWLVQTDELQALSAATLTAFKTLRSSFGALERYIADDGKGVLPSEIQQLMTDYGVLVDTYARFESRRKKLDASSLIR